ncbi:hypothetical protein VTH06DRAFT_6152, partial [Thermothelomyces fergusii]
MATPLTPTPSAALNSSTAAGAGHGALDAARKSVDKAENRSSSDDGDSSPFLPHGRDSVTPPTQRGPSPPKPRQGSRI